MFLASMCVNTSGETVIYWNYLHPSCFRGYTKTVNILKAYNFDCFKLTPQFGKAFDCLLNFKHIARLLKGENGSRQQMIHVTSKTPKEMSSQNEQRRQTDKLPSCLTVNKWVCLIAEKASNALAKCVDQDPRRNI